MYNMKKFYWFYSAKSWLLMNNDSMSGGSWTHKILPLTQRSNDWISFWLLPISHHLQKINKIAQFCIDIKLIQSWELLLACPGMPDWAYTNVPNQKHVYLFSIYVFMHISNRYWDIARLSFYITLGMPSHTWPHPLEITK